MDKLGVSTNFGWKLLKEGNRILNFYDFFTFRDILDFFGPKTQEKKSNEKIFL